MEVAVYYYFTDESASPAEVGRAVDERGIAGIFVPEHTHFPWEPNGMHSPEGHPLEESYRRLYDPFVALAAAAQHAPRARVGTAACLPTTRDPIMVAKLAASLDDLTQGRLVLGMGAGWHRGELADHGVDWPNRYTRLDEALRAMQVIWGEDEGEFEGTWTTFGPTWSWPKPYRRSAPDVLLAGTSPAIQRMVVARGVGSLTADRGGTTLDDHLERLRSLATANDAVEPPTTAVVRPGSVQSLARYEDLGLARVLIRIPAARELLESQLDEVARMAGELGGTAGTHDAIGETS